jgi:hypothetical protein
VGQASGTAAGCALLRLVVPCCASLLLREHSPAARRGMLRPSAHRRRLAPGARLCGSRWSGGALLLSLVDK